MFDWLTLLEDGIWEYLGVPAILIFGVILTVRARLFQIRRFPAILKLFLGLIGRDENEKGVHPLKVFFASVGGCIGIGNIVAVCAAVQIGGPGALFWLWVAGFLGMVIKYSEI